VRRLLAVRWFGGLAKRRLLSGLPADPHQPAVVLFTSAALETFLAGPIAAPTRRSRAAEQGEKEAAK